MSMVELGYRQERSWGWEGCGRKFFGGGACGVIIIIIIASYQSFPSSANDTSTTSLPIF